jgi:MscS family membrane protein
VEEEMMTATLSSHGFWCGRREAVRTPIAVLALASALATLPLGAFPAHGDEGAGETAPAPTAGAQALHDELERGSPRSSVAAYLKACREGDFEKAAGYLDLRQLQSEGAILARQLRVVLSRTLWVDLDALSDEPQGKSDDGLPPYRDRIGTITTAAGKVEVLLQRVPREDGVRIWKIAAVTVAQVPDLYQEFGYGPLERFLPQIFFEFELLDIGLWQWLALLILVILTAVVSWLIAATVLRLLRPVVARTATQVDDQALEAFLGPVRLAAAVVVFALGTAPLGLHLQAQSFFSTALRALFIVALTWFLLRIVDVLAATVEQRLRERGDLGATALVPSGRKAVKFAVLLVATVAALDSLGFSVTALVASLGVGGIAVALAAQKTIENLFAGATLYADQPVRVGDFCRFGDKVGTVEDIGIRSTRVRTLDRTLVTIPNAEFSSIQLENFAKRDRMRLFAMIGVRYETTPEQLRYILVEVRKLLYAHERVTPDPARIRFVGFGAYSLDLELFAYVDTADWSEFLGIREDILLRVMDIVEASGSGFAFPSQTLYLGKDEAPSPERAREVAEQVQGWRERSEIFLPDFPAERIEEIENTLRFPPEGSPGRADP